MLTAELKTLIDKIQLLKGVFLMKKLTVLNSLIFFPLISEIISMLILPAEIPVHYDSNLQVTAFGSKYMLFIIGIGVIIFGLFMKLVYRSNISTDSEIAIYRLCNIALLVFNIINGFALVGAFLYPQLKVAGELMDATGVI